MSKMDQDYQDKFLARPRYGFLSTLAADGSPRTVPVWFSWDGQVVRVFTGKGSAKVKRIQRNPKISLLVANDLDEHEAWVAFEGSARIIPDGGYQLAEQLAQRYWDMTDPHRQATVASWKRAEDGLCVIELVPDQIRTYYD